MRESGVVWVAVAAALLVLGAGIVWFRPGEPGSVPGITVPAGFEVEPAAEPPLVERPITIDFDEEGRLYVAESSGSNEKVEVQLEKKPHRILRLEDGDGDGRFDRRTVFAEGMMFPEGTLWHQGSLYVAAPPSIWKLTDTDGDGVADRREEWFQGKTLTACANDLHGPYLGPDGWIYWCKGGFAEQTYERPDGRSWRTKAAHIFRRHPDQPFVEAVLTGGMANPVDVDFTPEGERILTATFVEHPQLGLRDALIHAVYGGVYGRPRDVLEGHPKTGDLMDGLVDYGPAAPCGLTRYSSTVFGEVFQNNFFACLFNLRKVTRHELDPRGATFGSRDSDFLVSDDPDFHPTDVLEDADGSLLVVNTGGWYKLCCPTSQLEKADVLGAIYRVRRYGAPRLDDPRGRRIPWASLDAGKAAQLLADERPAVQRRAIQHLARLGEGAVPALAALLAASESLEARRHAVWALTRIDSPAAREAACLALQDADAGVRQAAAHSAGVWRYEGAVSGLVRLLQSDPLPVRRAAAEALGRIGDSGSVAALLAAADSGADRTLEHSLIFALIEIDSPAATRAGLGASSPAVLKAGLTALDQMESGDLAAQEVIPLLTSEEASLRETGWWIAEQHPEWGGQLAGFFAERLGDARAEAGQEELERRLVQFAGHPSIQDLLAGRVRAGAPPGAALTSLRVMARSRLKELPAAWNESLAKILVSGDAELIGEAVSVARSMPPPEGSGLKLGKALIRASQNGGLSLSVRLAALAAVPEGLSEVAAETFDLLLSGLEPSQPAAVRETAAMAFEKAKLSGPQLLVLARVIQHAGPMELPRLLVAFDQGSGEELGQQLIRSLRESKAAAVLRPDLLLPRLSRYPESVVRLGESLLASLDQDPAAQKAHLEELLSALPGGDVRRGQEVFNGQAAGCSGCHTIGYLGGKVGPDLTRIGEIRDERDLLEAVVYPSASFVRSYEPLIVSTESGEIHSGVVREDGLQEMVLVTGPQEEIRLSKSVIREMRPGTVSIMPSGLDEQLSRQQLADLLAFLKAAKRR